MRLIKNKIEHGGSGTVTLCPEEPEDMVCDPLLHWILSCSDDGPALSGTPTT